MEIYDQRDDPFDEAFADVDTSQESEVQKFYENRTVFITGGSGFLGMLLVEKLLRMCSGLNKIILLVRGKKGKSVDTRVREMFDDKVFEKMKLQNPLYRKQVEILQGSCEQPHFGLTDEQIRKLQSEVNIIFHLAANVQFYEAIRNIYRENVAGTETLLEIARGTKDLQAFVYVSTAYSQSHRSDIEEKFYPGPIQVDELKTFLKNFDDKTLNILTPKLLNGRQNTYVFTKGMAEELVSKYKSTLPIAICRPTIVTACAKEPWTSWINNIYGAMGVFFAAAVGFLRTLYCDPKCKAEIIPADRVVNGLIVVPKDMQKYWYSPTAENRLNNDPVYNFATKQSDHDFLTWDRVMELMSYFSRVLGMDLLTDQRLWAYHLSLDKNYLVWIVKFYVLHLLPAPFFVLMEKILKLRPRVMKGYVKLYNHTLTFSYFMHNSWRISQENTQRLYEELNSTDKILFNCNLCVDWVTYFHCICKGMGTYLINIDWSKTPKNAYLKMIILQILDKTLIWTCRILFLFLLWKIGCRWCSSYLSAEIWRNSNLSFV